MIKAVVVKDIINDKLMPFTLDKDGCVIILAKLEYDINNMIVTLMDLSEVENINVDLYTLIYVPL